MNKCLRGQCPRPPAITTNVTDALDHVERVLDAIAQLQTIAAMAREESGPIRSDGGTLTRLFRMSGMCLSSCAICSEPILASRLLGRTEGAGPDAGGALEGC